MSFGDFRTQNYCFPFFLVALSERFYENAFFIFLMKKAFWWRVACVGRAIGEKHDLGPAAHTVAARGLFDFTVPWWIHILVFFVTMHVAVINITFRDKTRFLNVFGGAADLTVVWNTKKTCSWNTQKCGRRWQRANALPPRFRQQKCEFVFRALTSSLFAAQSALNAD